MLAVNRIYFNQDIFFLLFLCSFFLIALLNRSYFKHTKLLVLGAFSQRYANQLLRQENFFTQRINFITFILIVINFSLFFCSVIPPTSYVEILSLIGIILGYYFLKIISISILGKIFILKELKKLIIFFSLLFDRVLSILIFPLLIGIYFFPFDINYFLLFLSLFFFLIIGFFKIFYFWDIGSRLFGLSRVYIFLYLCVLEFFPLLILVKRIIF